MARLIEEETGWKEYMEGWDSERQMRKWRE